MNMIRSAISSNIFRGLTLGIIVFSLALTLLINFANPILANNAPLTGYKYDAGTIDPISYEYFSVTTPIITAVNAAANAWNSTSAPGYFEEQWWALDPGINVNDGDYAGTWWGLTSFSADGDGTYSGNEVEMQFDTIDMANLTDTQKKLVAEHELGHAYGLYEMVDPGHAHCMIQGSAKFNYSESSMPSSGDVAGVDSIY